MGEGTADVIFLLDQADAFEDLACFFVDKLSRRCKPMVGFPLLGKDGNPHILEDRQPGKDVDHLERSCDPFLAGLVSRKSGDLFPLENDLAFIRLQYSGHQIEEGGLPGPVRTDDSHDFTLGHVKGCLVYRHKTAKGFAVAPDL